MIKLGWFAVRDVAEEALGALLSDLAAQLPREDVPDEFLLVRSASWVAANVGGWEYARVHLWAREAAAAMRRPTISFFVFEGLWEWQLHGGDELIAGMDARSESRAFLFGDLARAAEILGVSVSFFKAYCRSCPVPENLQGLFFELFHWIPGDNARAFPGDEHPPDEEWAHLDFAKRLGIDYPEPGRARSLLAATAKQSDSLTRSWPVRPPSLKPGESRRWPRRIWLERFHPRNWGE